MGIGLITIEAFQDEIGVRFQDIELLQEALTHRSYVNEHEGESLRDNERLEFLGDAIIDFIAGELLFLRFPEMREGDLTRMRAALVRTEALAALAVVCRVGDAMRMGKGEEASGGRERNNNLCGAFEALIGAIYLDLGMAAVKEFVEPLLTAQLEHVLKAQSDKDARSSLQEWSQATHNLTPVYRTISADGPDHEKEFTVEVRIGDRVVGIGRGRSKQAAAQSAAHAALLKR